MTSADNPIDRLGVFEVMAARAVCGVLPPAPYRVQLVKGCRLDSITGGPYLRLGIFYDGVEVADVGLFFDAGRWDVAGSGMSPLPPPKD